MQKEMSMPFQSKLPKCKPGQMKVCPWGGLISINHQSEVHTVLQKFQDGTPRDAGKLDDKKPAYLLYDKSAR
jgi:hypothetical protein